jgi:hypothetical protein
MRVIARWELTNRILSTHMINDLVAKTVATVNPICGRRPAHSAANQVFDPFDASLDAIDEPKIFMLRFAIGSGLRRAGQ